jgi:hypothetical protein
MRKTTINYTIIISLVFSLLFCGSINAQPYGKGVYGANVPYGSQTALSIATSGDITIPITPTESGTLATGSSAVTVTSTDVMGYKLYIRALNSTDMNNLGTPLPTSSNGTPAPLAVNTWGYNTDASSNFVGMSLSDALIKSISTPVASGDVTNVTYGIKLDLAKPAGHYVASVVYTAVPQTD